MEKVSTNNAPTPAGHYSQAIVYNGLIFVSGQLAVEPKTGAPVTDSIELQTEQCLRNIEAVLLAAGSDLNHLLKITIYVSDEQFWGAVNETVGRILGEHKPARAIIPVGKFRGDFLVEIEAVGAVKN